MTKRIDDVKFITLEDANAVSTFIGALAAAVEKDDGDQFEKILGLVEEGVLTIPIQDTVPILQAAMYTAARALVDLKKAEAK